MIIVNYQLIVANLKSQMKEVSDSETASYISLWPNGGRNANDPKTTP